MIDHITLHTAMGTVQIGKGYPTHLIAEIGLNHNGSVELAEEMIRSAALSGATFVKFQKRHPESLATATFLDAPFPKCPALGSTQREVRERLELTLDEYRHLRDLATSLGLIFFASAFDIPSLEFLMQVEVPVIKIASHSITNGPLLKAVAGLGIPVIASFGGTTEEDRDKAINILSGNPLVILHCVSSYPTPDHLALIDTIGYLRERYQLPVGFSSHENGIDISVAAALLGAVVIERHYTLDRSMIGLDQAISLEPNEFGEMAQKIRRLEKTRGISQGLQEGETAAKYSYHVGIYARKQIKEGTMISEDDIEFKQPLVSSDIYFTGLEMEDVVGKRTSRTVEAQTLIPREVVS